MKAKFSFKSLIAMAIGLLVSVSVYAQDIVVNGSVLDDLGEPVLGANVLVKGTSNGATTDMDGNFSLKAPAGSTLVVSFIGYSTQEVAAAPNLKITLKEDSELLEDVVVIGYGVAKKNDLTGSVVAIKPDDKNKGMVTSAQDMLQGKIAGVNVTTNSGAPGEGATIRIRGGASLSASNDPLIVIDGMALDANSTKGMSNPLALVNPNDIETFTVLKDASATAIYGSRGSNGVIIITTKKGTKGQGIKVNYDGNVSFSSRAKTLDVMSGDEYREFLKNYYGAESEAYLNAGKDNTDWQNEIYRLAVSHDHNVTMSGAVNKPSWSMPYRVSAGYTDQSGILKESNFKRVTAGVSLSPSFLKDHLTFNINAKYMYARTHSSNTGAIGAATSFDPTRPVKSSDEKYKNFGGYFEWVIPTTAYADPNWTWAKHGDAASNPVELIEHSKNNYSGAHTMLGNVEIDYKIHGFEDLHLHANFAGNVARGTEYTNNDPQSVAGFYYGYTGQNYERKYNLTASAYAQYLKDFNKDNHFDIMAGYEWSHFKFKGNSWGYGVYPSTSTKLDDDKKPLAGTKKEDTPSIWMSESYLVSFFGRANYTFKNRYMLTGTVRWDGSSRFAKGHQWGIFPSVAFAWRVKDEAFLADNEIISDLKLRLGYGQTGQQEFAAAGNYYYVSTYKKSTNAHFVYPVGNFSNPTLQNGYMYKPNAYNEDLTWETTTTYNVGVDLGLFDQRLVMNADVYLRKTTDLFNFNAIPVGMNYDNHLYTNVGDLENKGFELAITGKPIVTNDWFWEISVNVGYNKNKITKLNGDSDRTNGGLKAGTDSQLTYHKIGLPANSFYVYQQVYGEDGKPLMGVYVDRDGNGVVDEGDRYFYKSTTAPWTGGVSTKVSYKNWDFGMNFHGSFGGYVYNGIESGKINVGESYSSKGFYNNTTKKIAELGWTRDSYVLSDYFVQNASFFKCDNITVGYGFDKLFKTSKYKGISGRVYASCSNVFTITKYDGLDPEQGSGYEGSVYPRARTFQVGVNLNF